MQFKQLQERIKSTLGPLAHQTGAYPSFQFKQLQERIKSTLGTLAHQTGAYPSFHGMK